MSDFPDPLLQTLFTEAQQELDGAALTTRVMDKTRKLKFLLLAGGISAALVLLTTAWLVFSMPLLEFAILIAQGLGTTLFDLGEGWLALVFLPINNIAGLLAIIVKTSRMFHKKMIGGSNVNFFNR